MYSVEHRYTSELRSGHSRRSSSTSVARSMTSTIKQPAGSRSGHWQSTVSLPAAAARCVLTEPSIPGQPTAIIHKTSGESQATAVVGRAGGCVTIKVLMLDDQIVPFRVQKRALGRVLFDKVSSFLDVLEADYFGLEYQDYRGIKFWLDLDRPINRQTALSLSSDLIIWFCVKFYTPDPTRLEEEFTRYLFALQIKRDLRQGLLQCNENTTALMVSYIMQAELGDQIECGILGCLQYLRSRRTVSRLDDELERRVLESHKRLCGLTPAEAELDLLETARRCEMYGIKMHPAKDHEQTQLTLAVTSASVIVYHQSCKINTFSWPKIRKLSFKRRRFLIKLHPENNGYYKNTVEFYFTTRNYCKNFWKKCVEHHGFYRCERPTRLDRNKPRVIPRGSCFRFTGRTQHQVMEYARRRRRQLYKSKSFRSTTSLLMGHGLSSVGPQHLSAQPLIPTDLLAQDSSEGRAYSSTYGSISVNSPALLGYTSRRSTPQTTERDIADMDTISRADVSTSTVNSSSTQIKSRQSSIFSARAHCRSRRERRPPSVDTDRASPESEISNTLTDSLRPMRLTCSSRSLSETVEDTDTTSRTVHVPYRGGTNARYVWRRSSSHHSPRNGVKLNTDCEDIDNISHDSYDLLEDGAAAGWTSDRELDDPALVYRDPQYASGKIAIDDNDTSYSTNFSPIIGEITLIPFESKLDSQMSMLPNRSMLPVIVPPEPFLERRVEGVKTLPRKLSQYRDSSLSDFQQQTRSVEHITTSSSIYTGGVLTESCANHYQKHAAQNSVLIVNDMDPSSTELSNKYAFIEVNQLPARKAFSSRDDSLDDSTNFYSSPLPLDKHYKFNDNIYSGEERRFPVESTHIDVSGTRSASPMERGPNTSIYENVSTHNQEINTHSAGSMKNESEIESKEQNSREVKGQVFCLDIPHFAADIVRRNSSPRVMSNNLDFPRHRRGSLPDECLKIMTLETDDNAFCTPQSVSVVFNEIDATSFVAPTTNYQPTKFNEQETEVTRDENMRSGVIDSIEGVSSLTETSCAADVDDDSTLQYDTVPDESETTDLEVPEEFADQPPALPPAEYRISYEPMRALSRISERSTTSEMDSRLSTLTKRNDVVKFVNPLNSMTPRSISLSSEEPEPSEFSRDRDFPSPPSSLLEQSPIDKQLQPIGGDSAAAEKAEDSVRMDDNSTVSSEPYSVQHSHHSEALECAQTAGTDSEENGDVDILEELPGDDDCVDDNSNCTNAQKPENSDHTTIGN